MRQAIGVDGLSHRRYMRRKQQYLIRLDNRKFPHRVSRQMFSDWLERGFILSSGRGTTGRVAPGFFAWLEAGELRIMRRISLIGPFIRTNSRIFELLALYATWTPYLTPAEMEWEIQSEYNTDRRWNELRISADLGRTVFGEKNKDCPDTRRIKAAD